MRPLAVVAPLAVLALASCSTQNPEADLVSSWEVTFEHETGIRGVSQPEALYIAENFGEIERVNGSYQYRESAITG